MLLHVDAKQRTELSQRNERKKVRSHAATDAADASVTTANDRSGVCSCVAFVVCVALNGNHALRTRFTSYG